LGLGFWGLLKFKIGLEAFKISGPSGLIGLIFHPVGLYPIFRPIGLGLGVLFSKKPEPKPDLWAQARPTSTVTNVIIFAEKMGNFYFYINVRMRQFIHTKMTVLCFSKFFFVAIA
jgi:hypothetical protein